MDKKKETKKEDPQLEADRKLIWKCKLLEEQAREHRRKFDWQWLVRSLYVRGYHYASYNRGTNSIVFSTRTGVQIPINLVSAHLRGVRNQVTSFEPKWEVLPTVTTDTAFTNARYSGKLLDYIYEKAQIKRKIKEVVNDALMYSVGIWHFDIDTDKNLVITRIDPFDFLVDQNVKSPNLNDPEYGAEHIIITGQTSLESIRKNPRYKNTDKVAGDNLVASAEYKRFLLQVVRNQFSTQKGVNETVILKQAFIRERDESNNIKIRIIHYIDSMDTPLYNELTDESEYPIEILQGDIQPGELYGESWVKHLIPINRVIDALESHIFEYNHFFARGKWVVDKNSGVRLIVNQHGQILEKNRGSTVTPITVPPLPPSPETQIARMRQNLEDISGVHDVSLGRLPGTIRSGVAIAELRQSDATNQSDLVDNLEDFLSRAGRRILKLVAENWNTTRLVSVTGLGGKPEYFMAVGEAGRIKKNKFKMGDQELTLAVIGAENEVRVQVGSWLAYTKEARQEKLKELFRLGAIDQKTLLLLMEFGDIDGIYQRSREERILQSRSGSKSASIERQYGIQLDDESLALAENELMVEGIPQHAEPGDDHEIHIMVHNEEKDSKLVLAHIKEHEDLRKWQTKMNARPVPPEEMGAVPTPPPTSVTPETFNMAPPVGPGAPPFNAGQPVINSSNGPFGI